VPASTSMAVRQRLSAAVGRLSHGRQFSVGGAFASAANETPGATNESAGGYSFRTVLATGAIGVLGGVVISDKDARLRKMVRPSGHFQACGCDVAVSDAQKGLADKLGNIVGSSYVRKNYKQKGSRLGHGTALAYVQPGTLKEAVEVLQVCVKADVAILPQGANTSLTGGSVPNEHALDRPTVVINLRRLKKIMPIGEKAEQVLCFSGAGISDLKEDLAKNYNRDSHSVLGSLFLNPSVGAGVAYGSGGTQIRKGPAWTQRALFCKVTEKGEVEVVNTLGLKDGGDPMGFLQGRDQLKVEDLDPACTAPASWPAYAENVRKIDGSVARYNADTTGIDCNRSEGKVLILATLHDSFPMPKKDRLVWVSCKDYATCQALKKEVALQSKTTMAKQCEYMNREVFEGVDQAGRILIYMIQLLGMQRLEPLWNIKLMVELVPLPFTDIICDKFLWWFNNVLPKPLPKVLLDLGAEYDHHMLIEFGEYSDGEVDRLQKSLDDFVASKPAGQVKYHICEKGYEANRAAWYRFVVAPAFRTYAVGKGLQGLSIDYALPKRFSEYPDLPEKEYPIKNRWVYSHFGCNVFHEDFTFGPDVNVDKAKYAIKHAVEDTGGKLPAEHGHGTEYYAPADMQERWKKTDPLNVLNPGVGRTSGKRRYGACCDNCEVVQQPGFALSAAPA